jgi:hypothetical protein
MSPRVMFTANAENSQELAITPQFAVGSALMERVRSCQPGTKRKAGEAASISADRLTPLNGPISARLPVLTAP